MEKVSTQTKSRVIPRPVFTLLAHLSAVARWTGRYRVVAYLLLGLVLVDLLVAGQSKLWQAYDPDDYLERVWGCQEGRHDLILIGGSPVSEGIDPAVLEGLSWQGQPLLGVYNLGLPGATTADCWLALRHGITTPPRLLVYGITASDVNDSRNEPHGPRSLMDVQDLATRVMAQPEMAEWCVRQFVTGRAARCWRLYQYRLGIQLWAADTVERVLPGTCMPVAKLAKDGLRYSTGMHAGNGYAPQDGFQAGRLDLAKPAGPVDWHFDFLRNYKLGSHFVYVHMLLNWAIEQSVEIVLVDMPVSADLEEGRSPIAFANFRKALAEVEQTRGVRILRATRDAVGLTDGDFADLIHLNVKGSARFTRWLRGQLEDRKEGTP